MWPFNAQKKTVVVFHIDNEGHARGAYFRGNADILIIDERDPREQVYRMVSETPSDELRRKIGKHPLGRTLAEKKTAPARPAINLHWRTDTTQTA